MGIFPGIFRAPFAVRQSSDIQLLPNPDVESEVGFEDDAEDFAIDEDSD